MPSRCSTRALVSVCAAGCACYIDLWLRCRLKNGRCREALLRFALCVRLFLIGLGLDAKSGLARIGRAAKHDANTTTRKK